MSAIAIIILKQKFAQYIIFVHVLLIQHRIFSAKVEENLKAIFSNYPIVILSKLIYEFHLSYWQKGNRI